MTDHQEKEQKHVVDIFNKVSSNCLAYKKHLKSYRTNLKKVDFSDLPLSDKDNYTQNYPLEERMYEGKCLADYYMICTSSGSTAEPTIWPRDYEYDQGLEPPHTKFLENHFAFTKKKTLIVIAFGIGTTQAGMMHVKASWEGSVHGQVSVITPNADAAQTVFLLDKLHSHYEQIIVIGYPPIIVDFIDLAITKKLPINQWNLKIVFAGESVSPLWRKEIAKKIGGTSKNIVSFYGSTEAGMIGFESKEINHLVGLCLDNEELRFDLFKTFNLPTVVEVDFLKKFTEIVDGEIVITADQVIPLVRYNLHDRGIILDSKHIQAILDQHRIDFVYPKNQRLLVIYGRNLSRKTSIEDLQNAFAILNLDKYFYKEFQYEEQETNKSLNLRIVFYSKDDVHLDAKELKKLTEKFEKTVSKLIFAHLPIHITIKIADKEKRIGYQSGKLRYLITK